MGDVKLNGVKYVLMKDKIVLELNWIFVKIWFK